MISLLKNMFEIEKIDWLSFTIGYAAGIITIGLIIGIIICSAIYSIRKEEKQILDYED